LVFKHDFIRCVDFTRIVASNTATASDDVTHNIFITDLLYFCANFVFEIDEKFSLNGGV